MGMQQELYRHESWVIDVIFFLMENTLDFKLLCELELHLFHNLLTQRHAYEATDHTLPLGHNKSERQFTLSQYPVSMLLFGSKGLPSSRSTP